MFFLAACSDSSNYADQCNLWAQNGFCSAASSKEFMLKNCAKSCGFCSGKECGFGDPVFVHILILFAVIDIIKKETCSIKNIVKEKCLIITMS